MLVYIQYPSFLHKCYDYHVELEGSRPDLFRLSLKNDLTSLTPSIFAFDASVDTIRIVKGG
jgi:hypothetical protein